VNPAQLRDVHDERHYGGKAVNLGAAIRAKLPVPAGIALDVSEVADLAADPGAHHTALRHFLVCATTRYAVRSSAVGEDSTLASFAGQHLTLLHVAGAEAIASAVQQIWESAHAPSAIAYRLHLGILGTPQIAVVLQEMIVPTCAGVMFTRNPVTGADERVIEASWGLGESVVGGLVTPDRWRMARDGELLESTIGHKDIEIVCDEHGTRERTIPPARAAAPCLPTTALAALARLADTCEQHFDGASDIEFAFVGERVFLLQRRPITR